MKMVLLFLNNLHVFAFVGDLKGVRKIWLIGDNFLAETYRKSFKKSNSDFFIKITLK